jgi:tripartite-type tricarboxylate transporter receptor subunit TctC
MFRWLAVLSAVGCLATGPAIADSARYPSRLVTIVVPATPGGATGVIAQVLAQKLSETWGQRIIVENKPGGNHQVGAVHVAKADADGHTLFMSAEASFVINPFLYRKLNYDPMGDFIPVAGIVSSRQALIVNPSVPAENVAQLLELVRKKPGAINYGTTGAGSTGHLNAELLGAMAGVKLSAVHYRGGAPAVNDVIGGHIQMMIVSLGLSVPPAQAGQVRMLAVGARKRLAVLPDVPTVAESGLPGYEANTWFGLFAPAGTPRGIVDKINADVHRIFADPTVKQKYLDGLYFEPITGTPDEFARYVEAERQKWRKVIGEINLTVE